MKNKILSLLSLALVFALIFSFAGCSIGETEEETTTVAPTAATPLPTDITTSYDEESNVVTDTTYSQEKLDANTATIFEYFNLHVNELKSGDKAVKMSYNTKLGKSTDENGNSVAYSENAYINSAISLLKNKMLPKGSQELAEGESINDFMPVKGENFVSALTLEEVDKATCVDKDTSRVITVDLKSPTMPETIEKAFNRGSVEDVLGEFKKADKYLTVGTPIVTYKDCQIIIKADNQTDEISEIQYVKNMDVLVYVTGEGNLESIGTVPMRFALTENVTYSITLPEAEQ